MELGQLLKLFSEDPAGRLFKADNAPFVVDFLYHAFKGSRPPPPVTTPTVGAMSISS